MDSNNKPNWRRLHERCEAIKDSAQKKLMLHDAIVAIEADHGSSARELLYPYEALADVYHQEGDEKMAAMLLLKLYLVLEVNYSDEPDCLLFKIISIYEMGYVKEATYACNSLLYLLYETNSVEPEIVNDTWCLLRKLNKQFPERTAKKLLAYRRRKAA